MNGDLLAKCELPPAFQMALTVLAKTGFTQAEIDLMTKENPARLLGFK